jgi:hypothetical protein
MNRLAPTIRALGTLAIFVGVGLAGCSDHLRPPTPLLTKAQADSMGDAMVAEAQSELDAATATGATPFVFGTGPATAGAPPTSPPSCVPSISPLPPVNSDGDFVPDSVRLEWNDCVLGFRRGTDTIRGTIDIVDPTPTVTDRALKQVFTELARIFVDGMGRVRSITLNGSRSVIRDSSHIALNETGFQTDLVFRDGSTASHLRNWDASFTADVNGAIVRDFGLPSGTVAIDGSSTWTRNADSYALQVSTPTPLHYNASCTARPKFDTGQLVVIATRNGATSTVTIDFTACGQYTVTKS